MFSSSDRFINGIKVCACDIFGRIPFFPPELRRKCAYKSSHTAERAVACLGVPRGYENKLPELYASMTSALEKHGMAYEEYLLYDCAGKNDEYVSSFITELNRYGLYRRFNDRKDLSLFHDKCAVYRMFSKFYGRDVISLYDGFPAFEAFVRRHPVFAAKPSDSSCGDGVGKVDSSSCEITALFESLLRAGRTVCEELVDQHPSTAIFNTDSLNTVRAVTVLTGDNVKLFYPFLRTGRRGCFTDNGGSGGIIIPIDANTGILAGPGRDEHGRYYACHPDSGIAFRGCVLPLWSGAVKLADALASVRPSSRIVGWDIAATNTGWIMMEANIGGQFIGQQICDLKGKLSEINGISG